VFTETITYPGVRKRLTKTRYCKKPEIKAKWGRFIMSWVKTIGVFFAASAMVGMPLATSVAQGGATFRPWMSRYVPPHSAGGRQCPGLAWDINQVALPDKTVNLSGPIWFEDGSGISFAQGARQPDGRFTLDVKRQSGDGPTGTITGQRNPDGSIDATTAGPPCFEGTYHIEPGQTSTSTQ
jgi:hypothetical protein